MPPKHIEEANRIAKEHDDAIAPPPEGAAAETPPAPAADAAPPADVPPAAPADEGWEQKYQTLKGKYDSEVPRLSNDLRESRTQLNEVIGRLNAIEASPPAQTPPAVAISDEDIENFGPELADFIKRQATVVADGMVGTLRQENAQLKQQIEQTAAATGTVQQDRYFTKLAELVPDYEAINVDPSFLAWLSEFDQMAGVPRQAFLNTAFESRDAVRTANVFNAYKEATGTGAPAPAPGETPAPVAPTTGNGNGNGQSISPGAGTGGPAPVAVGNDKMWSGADIRTFTNDILRGQYKGREQEQNAIQADIDRAIVEGRIRL